MFLCRTRMIFEEVKWGVNETFEYRVVKNFRICLDWKNHKSLSHLVKSNILNTHYATDKVSIFLPLQVEYSFCQALNFGLLLFQNFISNVCHDAGSAYLNRFELEIWHAFKKPHPSTNSNRGNMQPQFIN